MPRAHCPLASRSAIAGARSPSAIAGRRAAAQAPGAAVAAARSPTTPTTRPPDRCSSCRTSPPASGRSSLVAETGSVLAHLAILARESGVATVVGHVGAVEEFPEGTTIDVDGDTGQVRVVDPTDGGDTA